MHIQTSTAFGRCGSYFVDGNGSEPFWGRAIGQQEQGYADVRDLHAIEVRAELDDAAEGLER